MIYQHLHSSTEFPFKKIVIVTKCDQRKHDLMNHDMLRFNYEIHFNDNIIRCFVLWKGVQSSTVCVIDSLSSSTNETYIIRNEASLKKLGNNLTAYNLIIITINKKQIGWSILFVKINEKIYILVTLDSLEINQ